MSLVAPGLASPCGRPALRSGQFHGQSFIPPFLLANFSGDSIVIGIIIGFIRLNLLLQ
jgi:hypothetical protein